MINIVYKIVIHKITNTYQPQKQINVYNNAKIDNYGLKLLMENNALQIQNVHNLLKKNCQFKIHNNVYKIVLRQNKIKTTNKNKYVKHHVLENMPILLYLKHQKYVIKNAHL